MGKRKYLRELLVQNDFEIVETNWPPGSVSRPHDHGKSNGVIWVLEGELFQRIYDKKTKKFLKLTFHKKGEIIRETPDMIHVMGNRSDKTPARALHMYYPRLKMKYYQPENLNR